MIYGNPITLGGGGSGDVYAFIIANYPAGSTCTASNGTTTLTAGDTSGRWVFDIPTPANTPESWTVTITDGTYTATRTVSITDDGQSTEIHLSYFVPDGYRELEYVGKTGTQYVNTGYNARGTTRLKGRFYSGQSETVVILFSSSSSTDYAFEMYLDKSYYDTWFILYGTRSGDKYLDTGITYQGDAWYEADMNQGTVTVTVDGGSPASFSVPNQSFTANSPIRLGALIRAANVGCTLRFGRIQIYNSNVLQRDLIPAYRMSDSAVGLWDRVTEALLLPNTGVLTAGPFIS